MRRLLFERASALLLVTALIFDPSLTGAESPIGEISPQHKPAFQLLTHQALTESLLIFPNRPLMASASERKAGVARENAKRLHYPKGSGSYGNPGRVLEVPDDYWADLIEFGVPRIDGSKSLRQRSQPAPLLLLEAGRALRGTGIRHAETLLNSYERFRPGYVRFESLNSLGRISADPRWVARLNEARILEIMPLHTFTRLISFRRFGKRFIAESAGDKDERAFIHQLVLDALGILGVTQQGLPNAFFFEIRNDHDLDEEVDLGPLGDRSILPVVILRRATLLLDIEQLLERVVYGVNHLIFSKQHLSGQLSDQEADQIAFVRFVAHVGWEKILENYAPLADGWELARRVVEISSNPAFQEEMALRSANPESQAAYLETGRGPDDRPWITVLFDQLFEVMEKGGQLPPASMLSQDSEFTLVPQPRFHFPQQPKSGSQAAAPWTDSNEVTKERFHDRLMARLQTAQRSHPQAFRDWLALRPPNHISLIEAMLKGATLEEIFRAGRRKPEAVSRYQEAISGLLNQLERNRFPKSAIVGETSRTPGKLQSSEAPADPDSLLSRDIRTLGGLNYSTLAYFDQLGVRTIGDLLSIRYLQLVQSLTMTQLSNLILAVQKLGVEWNVYGPPPSATQDRPAFLVAGLAASLGGSLTVGALLPRGALLGSLLMVLAFHVLRHIASRPGRTLAILRAA